MHPAAAPRAEERTRILVVDDDPGLRRLFREFLVSQGYHVYEADSGKALREVLANHPVDIVVLDVMMPGEDGLSIARSLSGRPDLGIIMVSALGSEPDRVIGLEVGADDYLAKPVSSRELLARIRAVLRRKLLYENAGGGGHVYQFDGWTCNVLHRTLHDPKNVLITLSEGEFSVLCVLMERPQRVLSRDQILRYARGSDSEAFDRAIDTQISRLRRKLGTRTDSEVIRTIRHEGYLFVPKVTRQ